MKVRVDINVVEGERYVPQSASKGESWKNQSVAEGERYVFEGVAANGLGRNNLYTRSLEARVWASNKE